MSNIHYESTVSQVKQLLEWPFYKLARYEQGGGCPKCIYKHGETADHGTIL